MVAKALMGLLLLACVSASGHEAHNRKPRPAGTAGVDAPAVQAPRPPRGELEVFLSHVRQPEYLHVVVNPLPLYAMLLGAAVVLAGLLGGGAGWREAGLALIVLAGLSALPAVLLGQSAYDRLYEQIDLEAQRWLDVHMARGESLQWIFYASAALAIVALVLSRRGKPAALRAAQASLCAALFSAALAGWISHAGGQVRHPEFRLGPPKAAAEPSTDERRHSEP